MELNGKKVINVFVGGVKTWDAPDFCDAYFEYAEFQNDHGLIEELTESQLDELQEKYPDVLSEMAHEALR